MQDRQWIFAGLCAFWRPSLKQSYLPFCTWTANSDGHCVVIQNIYIYILIDCTILEVQHWLAYIDSTVWSSWLLNYQLWSSVLVSFHSSTFTKIVHFQDEARAEEDKWGHGGIQLTSFPCNDHNCANFAGKVSYWGFVISPGIGESKDSRHCHDTAGFCYCLFSVC